MKTALGFAESIGTIFTFLNTKASKKYAAQCAELKLELLQMTNGTAMELQNDRRIEEILEQLEILSPIANAELVRLAAGN